MLVDKFGKFPLKTKDGCIVEVYNELPLNLLEEINKLSLYVNRFRLQFTNESYEEVIDIVSNAINSLNNKNHSYKLSKQTKGYFKRSIM